MDPQTLTGPLLYLLVAWGVVTAVFLVLLLRRSLLASHEDDQIFLDAAQEHMAREQREIVAKINALSRPIMGTGILPCARAAADKRLDNWSSRKSAARTSRSRSQQRRRSTGAAFRYPRAAMRPA